MSQSWIKKRQSQDLLFKAIASNLIQETEFTASINKVLASVLFWAEGSKHINHIAFTNSDPVMIETFITLLRASYQLDESKFHVSVHLHEYHNKADILNFWSRVTKISLTQFIRPYLKPHTSIRKHENYKGCITVRYYDVKIARELTAIYNALGDKYRDVVQW